MITIEHLTYRYPEDTPRQEAAGAKEAALPVLYDVSLHIPEGEFALVVGPSGAGKSTLLRCVNGLIPHFYGGTISGRICVAGRDPIAARPRQMSEVAGFVFQDPEAQAVVDVVEDELAFAMENHGLPLATMRERVEWVLEQLDIIHLRQRQISTLSGGERQRVAVAAVLTLQPRVLVLDEPTSQLDPQSAGEVLDTLVRLNRELGLTILLSEHRLERVMAYADRIVYVPGRGGRVIVGEPREVLDSVDLVPPVVELGKRLGWSPLPLTVEEARSFVSRATPDTLARSGEPVTRGKSGTGRVRPGAALEVRGLRFAYDGVPVLCSIDLVIRRGEFVALMGHNGAGKSTLLKQCVGLLKPGEGEVRVLGIDTHDTPVEELCRHVGYVPQNPNALLFADTVAEELAFTRRAQGMPPAGDERLLSALGLAGMRARYPRDLSVGERQRVAVAAVLVGDPEIILLDEPTRGLDYVQKAALVAFLQAQEGRGKTIVIVTHDVELVALCAKRVVRMEEGTIVVDGAVREVMAADAEHALGQLFASQIGRLFRDPRYLTVQDVVADLGLPASDAGSERGGTV
jgi:energy-coupling factor transporter ATP-binding protein EcfA2